MGAQAPAVWMVVGTGPGSPEYLVPAAVKAVAAAEAVAGPPGALALFRLEGKEVYRLDADLSRLAEWLRPRQDRAVAVLVTGDPGFYSLLDWLRREFPDQNLQVIPGISSVQMAFARLGSCWHKAVFVSLHGRGWEELDPYLPHLREPSGWKLVVLTGGRITPAALARYLLERGIRGRAWAGADLGRNQERCLETDLEDLAVREDFPAAAVVIIGHA
ncbi:MAG: precorrin-6y C5,15-methyltransferase (decarboxylating) subunit CbiE [Moorellales bacterium]